MYNHTDQDSILHGQADLPERSLTHLHQYEYSELFHSLVAVDIILYGAPLILILGTVGNILSILVMLRKSLRMSTTSLYLTVLAITDLILLYVGLLREWIHHYFLIEGSPKGCTSLISMITFIIYFEAWIIVSVSLERLVAVWFPIKHKYYFTRPKAAMGLVILAIHLVIAAFNFYYTLDGTTCHPKDNYITFVLFIYPWIDMVIATLLPVIIMLSSTIAIVWKLIKRKKKIKKKEVSSMTITLVTVNLTFLITTCPICIVLIAFPIMMEHGETTAEEFHLYVTTEDVLTLLYYINNAINFVLYCLSGRRFRRELLTIFGLKNRISPGNMIGSTTGQTGTNMSLNVDRTHM